MNSMATMDTEDMDMEGMDEEVMEVITVEDIIKLPSWRWELVGTRDESSGVNSNIPNAVLREQRS